MPLARLEVAHQLHHSRGVMLEPLPPGQGAKAVGERPFVVRHQIGDQPSLCEAHDAIGFALAQPRKDRHM